MHHPRSFGLPDGGIELIAGKTVFVGECGVNIIECELKQTYLSILLQMLIFKEICVHKQNFRL